MRRRSYLGRFGPDAIALGLVELLLRRTDSSTLRGGLVPARREFELEAALSNEAPSMRQCERAPASIMVMDAAKGSKTHLHVLFGRH